MKKAITICLLAIALLAGGIAMDAKTTKKKSSTGSSFNLKTVVTKASAYNYYPSNMSPGEVKSLMKDLGFTYQSSSRATVTNDFDETFDVDVLKFTKSGVTAEAYVGVKFVFKFNSSSNAKAFVTASKNALGSKLRNRNSYYLYLHNNTYWDLKQSGSTVTIAFEICEDGGESDY